MSENNHVELKPGWLARDVAKAIQRVEPHRPASAQDQRDVMVTRLEGIARSWESLTPGEAWQIGQRLAHTWAADIRLALSLLPDPSAPGVEMATAAERVARYIAGEHPAAIYPTWLDGEAEGENPLRSDLRTIGAVS